RAEESARSAEWRRMRTLDARHIAQQRREALRVAAPQHCDEWTAARDEAADRMLSELLPPLAAVTRWRSRPHGQDSVEQHHSLLLPRAEVSAGEHLTGVLAQLLRHVEE